MDKDSTVLALHNWIDANITDLVEALQGVLRIPSLQSEPTENAPFGNECKRALDYTLTFCGDLGFKTYNDAGYAGHCEFGSGVEMVAALGHLDVVPEGDGWTHPPYGAEISDGYIYARGASDDKGPTYAALFGAYAIMILGIPLTRRIRVVFGCNEESGFGCVHHYWEVSKNERPVAAFTPDSRFPLIYAEKGIVDFVIEKSMPSAPGLKITAFSGGRRPNMVPDSAQATVEGDDDHIDSAVSALAKFWDKNVSCLRIDNTLEISAVGKSAHGARPEGGDNAVARLVRALLSLNVPEWAEALAWINRAAETEGRVLGIAHTDDVAGPLTSNLGIAEFTPEGKVRLTYNIRYPVTWNITALLARLQPVLDSNGWELAGYTDQPPLYVPQDQEPVATLLRVYQEETGDLESVPGTMGGGTYARATPNAVAFGAAFPGGSDGPAHEPDERISIENLVKAAKIYAHALYELAK